MSLRKVKVVENLKERPLHCQKEVRGKEKEREMIDHKLHLHRIAREVSRKGECKDQACTHSRKEKRISAKSEPVHGIASGIFFNGLACTPSKGNGEQTREDSSAVCILCFARWLCQTESVCTFIKWSLGNPNQPCQKM